MNEQKSHFKDELRIVPPIAVWLAVAAFAQMQILFAMLPKGPHGLPPFPIWALISVVAGIVLAMWILLIGYINQDAKRRGMGQLLWTMIAILVPNCLGILLYFLLRKPPLVPCAKCLGPLSADFRYCPKCGYTVSPSCANCGRAISHEYVCCPYCGKPVRAAATS
jgi:hypothetical protein